MVTLNLPLEMSKSLGKTYFRIGIFSLKMWVRHHRVVFWLIARPQPFPAHVSDLQLWKLPTVTTMLTKLVNNIHV